jgi:hypothetical protein
MSDEYVDISICGAPDIIDEIKTVPYEIRITTGAIKKNIQPESLLKGNGIDY